jgi:flagellar biosynthesis chaperone FliJ
VEQMDNKAELVIMALQQRIGELVSNYETQVAVLRAEITHYSQEQEEKEKASEEYSKTLEEKTSKHKSV